MLSQLFIFAIISVLGRADVTTYECPRGISKVYARIYGQNCYEFNSYQKKEYPDAQDYCKKRGGHLAVIKDKGLNEFISHTLEKTFDAPWKPFWIGLKFDGKSKRYQWIDGSPLGNYHHIRKKSRYDHSGSGDCLALVPKSRAWFDYKCENRWYQVFSSSTKKRFICEYAAFVVITTHPPPVTANPTPTPPPPNNKVHYFHCPKNIRNRALVRSYSDKLCYTFEFSHKNGYDAEKFCQSLGGHLAFVESSTTNVRLHYHLDWDFHRLGYFEAWIGLRYNRSSGHHYWINGNHPVTYTNFLHDTFNPSDECVVIGSTDGKWRPKQCTSIFIPFICEFKPLLPKSSTSTTTATTTTTRSSPQKTKTKSTTAIPTTAMPMTSPKPTTTPASQAVTTMVPSPKPTTTPASQAVTTMDPSPKPTTEEPTNPTTTTTCPSLVCSKDCGMNGFQEDQATGCMVCQCN